MELRTQKYRVYPSRKQKTRLLKAFEHSKLVYNTLLELNHKLWTTKRYDFNSLVKDIKICHPEISDEIHSQALQNSGDRLSKAFDNFFRRVKERKAGKKVKAGFPRFKSRVTSITYPQAHPHGGFKFVSNKRLFCSKIGNVPIVLHRIPKGKIKTLTIKQNRANQWFAVFSCELNIPIVQHAHPERHVGIDVGTTNYAVLTNGTSIPNPRFLVKSEQRLKRLQKRLNSKIKGSQNRAKARLKLARQHVSVANQRLDWQHKLSRSLALQFGRIGVEDLNVKGMMSNHCLAKHIGDASWVSFLRMLQYKAVTSGGVFVENPKTRGSSQRCSKCGRTNSMPLSKKTLVCACGFVCHRDVNASINHLNDTAGLAGISTPVDTEPPHSLSGSASLVVEAGTINGK